MSERMYSAWRERIESELGASTTYESLGANIGPGVRIEPIHVSAPRNSGAHAPRRGAMRYEPVVHSVDALQRLFAEDPEMDTPAMLSASGSETDLSDAFVPIDVYIDAAAGADAAAVAIAQARRSSGKSEIGVLVDPLTLACLGDDRAVASDPESLRDERHDGLHDRLRGELIELARSSGAAAGCVDALAVRNAGAAPETVVAWTLYSLSKWLDRLDPADLATDGLLGRIRLVAPVGNRPIIDTATLTCIRDLSSTLVAAYAVRNDVSGPPGAPVLHAVSETDSIVCSAVVADDAGNLVRATYQAVAAASAGADILSLLPYDAHREPTSDSYRLSAGIHRLLRHESRLDVTDQPLAGSYAFETIVRTMSDAARTLFLELNRRSSTGDDPGTWLTERIRTDRASADSTIRVGLDRFIPDTEAEVS